MMMTNFRKVLAIFAGSIILMTSCSDIDDSFLGSDDGTIALRCSRSAAWALKSPATDSDGKGSFEPGDRIEMSITGGGATHNATLQYSGSQWMPALRRSEYGMGELRLSAIYPILAHDTGNDGLRTISLPTDQSTAEGHNSADILFATTTVKEGAVAADMQFGHAMHRIKINLKGSVPDDLTIEVKTCGEGTMAVSDGSMALDGSAGYVWQNLIRREMTPTP